MPAVPPGSLVLVTGASGFIAVHVVKTFLEAGCPVRGTVRSKEKGEYLSNLFKDSKTPFEYVIVEDIAEPGAFDEAVKGVAGVAHTASPFHFNVDDPKEFIEPAVNGTLGVLKSVQKNNPDVKRVVITSSVASVMDEADPRPHLRNEEDWNETSIRRVEEKGRDAAAGDKYRASKTLAERAFWKFIADEKPSWDGATICPPLVYGPILQQVSKTSDLNTSNATILDWLTGNKSEGDIPDTAGFNWVDVRDVALAHFRALTIPEAGGERFIVGNGPSSPNDLLLSFERHYPDRKTYPKGDASKVESINAGSNRYDGSKAERVLGIKYHDIDTSVKDTVDSLIKRLGV